MALITPSQRFAALLSAKTLLTGGENSVLFMKSSPPAPKPTPMIRIAEYILTGVDYRDSDPATAGDAHYSGYPEEEPEAADGGTAVIPDSKVYWHDPGHEGDSPAGPPLKKDEADPWALADKDGTL